MTPDYGLIQIIILSLTMMISCIGAFISDVYSDNQSMFMLVMMISILWLIVLVKPYRLTKLINNEVKQ